MFLLFSGQRRPQKYLLEEVASNKCENPAAIGVLKQIVVSLLRQCVTLCQYFDPIIVVCVPGEIGLSYRTIPH